MKPHVWIFPALTMCLWSGCGVERTGAIDVPAQVQTKGEDRVAAAALSAKTAAAVPDPEARPFPADACIKVTDHGAIPDDGRDDAVAIQTLIHANVGDNRTLCFPDGVYDLSAPLEWRVRQAVDDKGVWRNGLTLQGYSRAGTILRLKDDATGFADTQKPRAMIVTASRFYPDKNPARYLDIGEGNNAFNNYIFDLTIDTGVHSEAVGIDWLANNVGAIKNVTVRGRGAAGIRMVREHPGPSLLRKVSVEGFRVGIDIGHTVASATLEHIALSDQTVAGIYNRGNALFVLKLTSSNRVPALQNVSRKDDPANNEGFVALIDSVLKGGAAGRSAIENSGGSATQADRIGALYLRDVKVEGYGNTLSYNGAAVAAVPKTVVEYSAHARLGAGTAPAIPIATVPDTPGFHEHDLSRWKSVTNGCGVRPPASCAISGDGKDDTDAIQAALNTGDSTVYFPRGVYRVTRTLTIGNNVRRIIGMHASIDWGGSTVGPVFRVQGDVNAPPLIVERFRLEQSSEKYLLPNGQTAWKPRFTWFEHASGRQLVLRHIGDFSYGEHEMFRNTAGAGALFIEDVAGGYWYFTHPQRVWARQFDPEWNIAKPAMHDMPLVEKSGSTLWVLGLKTEGRNTVIRQTGRGRLEILGGLLYPSADVPLDRPAFVCEESACRLSVSNISFQGRLGPDDTTTRLRRYNVLIEDRRSGFAETAVVGDRAIAAGQIVNPGHKKMPFYVGRQLD